MKCRHFNFKFFHEKIFWRLTQLLGAGEKGSKKYFNKLHVFKIYVSKLYGVSKYNVKNFVATLIYVSF